jgi:uncharacterized protein involved in exopolysaccharide biosynthesis
VSDTEAPPSTAVQGLSLVELVIAVLRYRRLVVAVALTVMILAGGFVFLKPRTYTASSSFTPQATRSPLGGLGGLAAQFGVAVPTADGNQSPAFYADLLRSRTILDPIVRMPVSFAHDQREVHGTYVELSRATGRDSLRRDEQAVRRLRDAMAVSVAPRTGIVRLELTTRYPELSAILTDSAIGLLNRFNVESRRSQAAAQRQFLEQRLATVSRELEEAEDAVRDFAKRNRGDLRGSPELQLQQERLNRAVSLRVQVHGGLAQALEQAKLDEIRDTPLITVIEPAQTPLNPDPRGLLITTMIAAVVGVFLGSILAMFRHAIALNREARPADFAALSADAAAARADLLRIVLPFRKRA